MTTAEARAEAVRRWGPEGLFVQLSQHRVNAWQALARSYVVGTHWDRTGTGPTWEAAFADYDRQYPPAPEAPL